MANRSGLVFRHHVLACARLEQTGKHRLAHDLHAEQHGTGNTQKHPEDAQAGRDERKQDRKQGSTEADKGGQLIVGTALEVFHDRCEACVLLHSVGNVQCRPLLFFRSGRMRPNFLCQILNVVDNFSHE